MRVYVAVVFAALLSACQSTYDNQLSLSGSALGVAPTCDIDEMQFVMMTNSAELGAELSEGSGFRVISETQYNLPDSNAFEADTGTGEGELNIVTVCV